LENFEFLDELEIEKDTMKSKLIIEVFLLVGGSRRGEFVIPHDPSIGDLRSPNYAEVKK
jgi:hypothetical protein